MTDAREIIARHLCTMAAQGWSGISAFERAAYRTTAAGMVEAINASGIRFAGPDDRILGPDEVEDVRRIVEIANRNEWSAEGDRLVGALGRKA